MPRPKTLTDPFISNTGTGKQCTCESVNLLLIFVWSSILGNMLLLISQLAGYLKSNRNRYLLADNMTKEATLQGINLCSTRTVALWNDTKAAVVQNTCRLRVQM